VSGGDALVIAVDCSTTAAKAVIYDEAGQTVAQAAHPLSTLQPRPAWHEQDAEQWWTATQGAIAEAVGALVDPGRVRALCITHQRESFVCLDSGGRALRPAILWLDGRAHEEIAELGSTRVHEVSGKPPDTTPAIYKLAWLARHEPAVLRNAVHVGDVQAYLVWRLTGRWATSHGSADTLGLFDLRRMDWPAELLDLAGVRVEQLPELVPAGEEPGTLSRELARSLGLPGAVPVVSGKGDGQAAGLGLGATLPGVAYLNLGTSMALGVQSEEYLWDPAFRTLAGIRAGKFTLETVLNAAAYVATWCRERSVSLESAARWERTWRPPPPGFRSELRACSRCHIGKRCRRLTGMRLRVAQWWSPGLGVPGSPARACGVLPAAPRGREVLDDPSTVDGYDALFAVYRRMYPALSGLFPDPAAAANAIAAR